MFGTKRSSTFSQVGDLKVWQASCWTAEAGRRRRGGGDGFFLGWIRCLETLPPGAGFVFAFLSALVAGGAGAAGLAAWALAACACACACACALAAAAAAAGRRRAGYV